MATFYEMARSQDGKLYDWQIDRLVVFERGARWDNFLYEVFDMATDIIFILVLFDQAGGILL